MILSVSVIESLMLCAKHSTGHGQRARRVKPVKFQTETLPRSEVRARSGGVPTLSDWAGAVPGPGLRHLDQLVMAVPSP